MSAWYVEMFGATIAADTIARGAPQIFVELGGITILIRGRRPWGGFGTQPADPALFRFLTALCADLRKKGGRGRDGRYRPPPAQIRTCRVTAYGSCLRS